MEKETGKAGKRALRRLMVTKYIALPQGLTVEEGVRKWRETVHEAMIAYNIYIVDSGGKLVGLLTMRELLWCTERGTKYGWKGDKHKDDAKQKDKYR